MYFFAFNMEKLSFKMTKSTRRVMLSLEFSLVKRNWERDRGICYSCIRFYFGECVLSEMPHALIEMPCILRSFLELFLKELLM